MATYVGLDIHLSPDQTGMAVLKDGTVYMARKPSTQGSGWNLQIERAYSSSAESFSNVATVNWITDQVGGSAQLWADENDDLHLVFEYWVGGATSDYRYTYKKYTPSTDRATLTEAASVVNFQAPGSHQTNNGGRFGMVAFNGVVFVVHCKYYNSVGATYWHVWKIASNGASRSELYWVSAGASGNDSYPGAAIAFQHQTDGKTPKNGAGSWPIIAGISGRQAAGKALKGTPDGSGNYTWTLNTVDFNPENAQVGGGGNDSPFNMVYSSGSDDFVSLWQTYTGSAWKFRTWKMTTAMTVSQLGPDILQAGANGAWVWPTKGSDLLVLYGEGNGTSGGLRRVEYSNSSNTWSSPATVWNAQTAYGFAGGVGGAGTHYLGRFSLYFQDNDGFGRAVSYVDTETVSGFNAPTVPTLTSPNGGETINASHTITWAASTDPDGDPITYELQHNQNGAGWVNIATGISGTSYAWNTSTLPDGTAYKVRVRAKDSVGAYSSYDESNAAFTIQHNAAPNTPTLDSPANGATIYAGQSNTFQFDATDPDSGDSMASYALRITIDGVTRYWRASDNTWQAAETFNPSAQAFPVSNKQIVIPAHEFNDFDSQGTGTWSVAVRDTAGLTSAYSSTRSLTISQGFIGWGIPI